MVIGCMIGLPFVGALATYIAGKKNSRAGDLLAALLCVAELLLACALSPGSSAGIEGILGFGIHFKVDGFRAVYAVITAVMWAGTAIFSLEYFKEEREHLLRYEFFMLLTLGATEGVMLSADFMTAFIAFEILSFTSFTWVIHEQTAEAIRAGYTYLFIAVIGGLVLLMGLLMLYHVTGTLVFDELHEAVARVFAGRAGADGTVLPAGRTEVLAAGVLILLGFGAKAGMFPLHIWLPKAHPVAPSPGSALLSGILTKVGIYGILMVSLTALMGNRTFGLIVLVPALITMVLGAVLALFSVNLKRTLACSSMSQIGFILTGVAMNLLLTAYGSEEAAVTALPGLMMHMVNHSLIKLALFMIAGVVVMNLHELDLNVIRGYGRNKLFLKISFALGALGISGVPFFNGYISKTLLHEGIVEGIHECADLASLLRVTEWVFLFSGGITFAYMLKLFICVFVEKNRDAALQARYDSHSSCMNPVSTGVIFVSALLMPLLGQPAVSLRIAFLMTGSREILHFHAFSPANLKGGLISLGIGAFLYLAAVRHVFLQDEHYVNLWPEKLDLENAVYRPLLTRILPAVFGSVISVFGENRILIPLSKAVLFVASVIGRALETSMDGLIVFMHRTVFRARRPQRISGEAPGKWNVLMEEVGVATDPIMRSFSFALMMTCIGILIVLGTLMLLR